MTAALSHQMPSGRRRVAYIDGLRAVAVLLVVAHHALKASDAHGLLARFVLHGNHGVELFFVLSGFCLSYPTLEKLRREKSTSFDLVRYAAHRLVRIVPPYWLAIVATLVFGFIIVRMGYTLPESFRPFTALDVVKQAFFIDRGVAFVSVPFWTLPVEFRWYLFFPLMLWLWTKSPTIFATVGAIVFFVFVSLSMLYDALLFPAFLLGIVAANIYVRQIRFGWWPLAVCAAVLTYAALTPVNWNNVRDLIPIWYIASFAFVVAAGELPWLQTCLSTPALTIIGIASYSIYLVHDPVVTFICARGFSPVLAAVLGVAAGFSFWYVAERPFVDTPLRQKMTATPGRAFSRCLQVCGIRERIRLADDAA